MANEMEVALARKMSKKPVGPGVSIMRGAGPSKPGGPTPRQIKANQREVRDNVRTLNRTIGKKAAIKRYGPDYGS